MITEELLWIKTVSEMGSISKAAEGLHISRITLSNTISRVETELQVQLFHRTNSGMVLTPEGLEYIIFANQVLRKYDTLKSNLSLRSQSNAGLVTLASSGMLYRFFLSSLLQDLNLNFPDIKMKILDPTSPTIEHKLSLCEIDMAVLHTPVEAPGLLCKSITKEALMMIVPKGHAIEKKVYYDSSTGRSYFDIKDLQDEKIALSMSSHRERKIIDSIMYGNHISPNIIAEFRRYETVLPFILVENAITFTMHSFCIATYSPQNFNYYWVKGQEECFELAIITSNKLMLTKAAQAVQAEILHLIPSLLIDIDHKPNL